MGTDDIFKIYQEKLQILVKNYLKSDNDTLKQCYFLAIINTDLLAQMYDELIMYCEVSDRSRAINQSNLIFKNNHKVEDGSICTSGDIKSIDEKTRVTCQEIEYYNPKILEELDEIFKLLSESNKNTKELICITRDLNIATLEQHLFKVLKSDNSEILNQAAKGFISFIVGPVISLAILAYDVIKNNENIRNNANKHLNDIDFYTRSSYHCALAIQFFLNHNDSGMNYSGTHLEVMRKSAEMIAKRSKLLIEGYHVLAT